MEMQSNSRVYRSPGAAEVYLARLHGAVSYRDERIFFTTMDFTTKLFASTDCRQFFSRLKTWEWPNTIAVAAPYFVEPIYMFVEDELIAHSMLRSMILAGIRSSEFQEVLLSMLANTQTSFKRALKIDDTTPMLWSL